MVMKVMQMNADYADSQVKLLQECVETLASSRKVMVNLREGQTASLWTADGKAVALTDALKGRYNSAQLWLDEIGRQLEEARVDLETAIKETDQLDDGQKAYYQNLLYNVSGGPTKAIAV